MAIRYDNEKAERILSFLREEFDDIPNDPVNLTLKLELGNIISISSDFYPTSKEKAKITLSGVQLTHDDIRKIIDWINKEADDGFR